MLTEYRRYLILSHVTNSPTCDAARTLFDLLDCCQTFHFHTSVELACVRLDILLRLRLSLLTIRLHIYWAQGSICNCKTLWTYACANGDGYTFVTRSVRVRTNFWSGRTGREEAWSQWYLDLRSKAGTLSLRLYIRIFMSQLMLIDPLVHQRLTVR